MKLTVNFLGSLLRRSRPQPLDLTSINTSDNPGTTTTNMQQQHQPIPSINEFMTTAVASSPQMLNNGNQHNTLASPAMYANLYAAASLSAVGFMHPPSPMLASLAAASPAFAQAYVAAAVAAASSPQLMQQNATLTPRYNNNSTAAAVAISSMFGNCSTPTTTNGTSSTTTINQFSQTSHNAACALVANCTQQSPFQQQNTFFQFPPFSNSIVNNNNNNNLTTTNSSFLSAASQNFSNLSNFPMALAMLSPSLHALSPYFSSHSLAAASINTPMAMSSKFNQRSPDALKTPIIKDLSFAYLPQH